MNARKFRFPILIGAGVVAAGVLLYQSNSRIDSSQTRGEIAQRDVYRDSQVNPEDVNAMPGNAPVAAKALLESKEFKTLAANPAYHDLLASQSFEALAHNQQFLAMLGNPSFAELSKSKAFADYLRGGSAQDLKNKLDADAAQGLAKKLDTNGLSRNQAFNNLMANASFLSLMKSQDLHQELARLISMGSFADLVNSSSLQGLLARSDFQKALQTDLSSNLRLGVGKK